MKPLLWVVAVCVAFFSFHPVVYAIDPFIGREHIQEYDVSADIRDDGTVRVVERIMYDFALLSRHGVYRDIPRIKTNEEGVRYQMTVSDISVYNGNTKAPILFQTDQSSDMLRLKIGDPKKEVRGVNVYEIGYTVLGALTYFSDHDEFYWNAVGTSWTVPVTKAVMTVSLPQPLSDSQLTRACFVGTSGSRENTCKSEMRDGKTVFTVSRSLLESEGFTTVVGFPKGIVSVLEPTREIPFFSTPIGIGALIVLGVLIFFWYVIFPFIIVWKWFTGGRDPKPTAGEVTAWFSPPKNKRHEYLTPIETGGLIDESVDMRDIYATIIDLARRGYITLVEKKESGITIKKNSSVDWADLRNFEHALLSGIFGSTQSVLLKSADLSATIHSVSDMVYTSLVSDGLFPKNPKTIRLWYIACAVLSLITINPVLLLVSLTFGLAMPRKTLFGAQQAAVARALKRFLSSQKEQLSFQAKQKFLFEKLLPYAIAFGVEELWAKRFASAGFVKPSWYESSDTSFTTMSFVRSIHRGYSQSFVYSSYGKSTSGFSSGLSSHGGFSGGGGGGGGGGSW